MVFLCRFKILFYEFVKYFVFGLRGTECPDAVTGRCVGVPMAKSAVMPRMGWADGEGTIAG